MVDLGLVVKYLGLASEAARTNWFGLGCPAFCKQPSIALLLLVAVLGFILGCLATTYTFWTCAPLDFHLRDLLHPLCLVATQPWLGTFMSVKSLSCLAISALFEYLSLDLLTKLLIFSTTSLVVVLLLLAQLLQVRDLLSWWPRRRLDLHHRLRLLPAHLWLLLLCWKPGTPLRHRLCLHQKLVGSSRTGLDRLQRAWRAGQWAKAVADGRIPSPNRTPPLFVALVTVFNSAGSYWQAIGDLSTSPSISHAFPSQTEAESVLANDALLSSSWTLLCHQEWKKKSHINVFETEMALQILKHQCQFDPGQRQGSLDS